jgi:hypothetical protein
MSAKSKVRLFYPFAVARKRGLYGGTWSIHKSPKSYRGLVWGYSSESDAWQELWEWIESVVRTSIR